MASPIRPSFPQPTPRPAPAETALAAQRAFFQAALGKAEAAVRIEPVPQPAPIQTARAAQPDSNRPLVDRIPRPGSILDIKV